MNQSAQLLTTLCRATQSRQLFVVVGGESNPKPYHIPHQLLTQYSLSLKERCTALDKEAGEPEITFSEVDPVTFDTFLLWAARIEPHLPEYEDELDLVKLSIFAETHDVLLLKNQTLDHMRKAMSEDRWAFTPELTKVIYSHTLPGSDLRKLVIHGFRVNPLLLRETNLGGADWKGVFQEFSNLGWDYFLREQTIQKSVTSVGPCFFHDHSDIVDRDSHAYWRQRECPFPYGAPVRAEEAFDSEMLSDSKDDSQGEDESDAVLPNPDINESELFRVDGPLPVEEPAPPEEPASPGEPAPAEETPPPAEEEVEPDVYPEPVIVEDAEHAPEPSEETDVAFPEFLEPTAADEVPSAPDDPEGREGLEKDETANSEPTPLPDEALNDDWWGPKPSRRKKKNKGHPY
ncbi:MAG: hypothetical protein M1819_006375 [Sarea resinae]|nr:MAG: hypothetical protein M1819_006375 [Sarea resinae]